MKVTYGPREEIREHARSARKVAQAAVDKVATSITAFGWQQPLVVDRQGVIICGHARWLAMQKLGLRKIPVHVAENLTPA
jgi:ParB-like chromosome segregation protein Spo0J